MRVFAVNGSPHGERGNTDVLVRAFLEGARREGAETETVHIAEKRIGHCRGCRACWSAAPARCVQEDDMAGILARMAGTDLIVLATPVHLANVSGMLKVFVDRLTVTGSPHAAREAGGGKPPAAFVLAATCGYPDKRSFDVIRSWTRTLAAMMGTRVAAELLAAQGKLLAAPAAERSAATAAFLEAAARAGAELVRDGGLTADTAAALERGAS